MSNEHDEFFKVTEEWFTEIPDKTENGLRIFLRGEYPADAGESVTQKIGSSSALLIYNYDLEVLRYKFQRKFSETAIFDRTEIKYLKQTFGLTDLGAEAVHFANLIILRNEYVHDCLTLFEEFLTSTLSAIFQTIDQEGIPHALKKFRKASNKAKTTFVEGIGFSYFERLKQNAHLFIKTPNVGRPPDTGDKTERINSAISKLLQEGFGLINDSNKNDILAGIIPTPKITKLQVADKLKISRPTFDTWLRNSNLNFEEQVNHTQIEFYKTLKKQ